MTLMNDKNKSAIEGTSPESKLLGFLNEMIEGSIIEETTFYIEDSGLKIEPKLVQLKKGVAQVVFILRHECFQEEIVESVAGVGPTSEESMKNAVIQFITSAFTVMQCALKDEKGQALQIQVLEKENSFMLYKGNILSQGVNKQEQARDYWELLGDQIKKHIGNKRVYFVKVYVAKTKDAVICECRVNGRVYKSFNDKLTEIAQSWEVEGPIYSEKQIFILIQEESTYKPYPLTQKEVEQYILSSLLLYRQCDSQEAYDKLQATIVESCKVRSLGEELFCLIPEIFTEVIFDEVTYSEDVLMIRGEEEIEISKHQLTTYDWIYNIIERTIRAGYFEKAQVDHIISCSAMLNSINQALNDGSKLENLCTVLALPVSSQYEIL